MKEDKLDSFDNIWKRLSDLEQTIIDIEDNITNQEINDLLENVDSYSDDIDSFQETYKDLDMSEQLSEVLMRCEHYLLNLQKVSRPVKKSVATKKAKPKKMSVKKQIK